MSHVRLPGELDVLAFKKIASLPAWDVDLGGCLLLGWGNAHGEEEMNQSAPESPEDSVETLRALAGQYVNRHSSIGNYIVNVATDFWLLRRLGLEPLSWPGRLVAGVFHFLMALLPALILTAITSDGSGAPLVSWTIFAVGWGGLFAMAPVLYRPTAHNLLSWLWVIVNEGDLRRLVAWHRGWYNLWLLAAVSATLTLGAVLPFYLLAIRGLGMPLPDGALYIGTLTVYVVMQNVCGTVMMAPEAYNLSTCRYELYRLSPADSVAVRRSLLGYNQFALLNIAFSTLVILLLLLVLPGGSALVAPVVFFLLLLEVVSTAVGTLVPRLLMGHVIRAEKEKEMEILQARLNDLLPRLEELTEEEYEKMRRLQDSQDAIRDSPDNLLPLVEIAKVVGALLLSIITVLVTAFAQEWFSELAKRLFP